MRCILCDGDNFEKVFIVDGHEIVRCCRCGLIKTNKVRMNYSHYHRDVDYKKFDSHFKNIFKVRFNLVKKYKNKGKVLDIGCATGTLLSIFKEKGWEVWGVEPSSSSEIASARGIKVLQSTFEEAKLNSNFFDVVILNHTLEHVNNPIETLKKAHSILNKGGLILIDVPNFGSLSSRIYKSKWPYILPNEHTFHFTPDTLKKVIKKSGFKVIHTETRSGLFDYADPIKEVFEALFTFKKRFFNDVIGLPGAIVSTYLGMGTSLTIIAQK
jgi:2-polyprenyl-3-methyl-5-hydroxy-6-metoxy-1,4-benzoquinol methylase